jgi:osmotically-inducible protein OsmY
VDEAAMKVRAEAVVKRVKGVESVDDQIRVRRADRHA